MNILIIEDDPIWQLKLQMMVEQLNLGTIDCVSTISDAELFLAKQLPDLIIADIVLSDGIVFNLLQGQFKEIPTILVTSYSQENFLSEALSMPHIGFLVKPFDRLTFKASLEIMFARLADTRFRQQLHIEVIGKFRQRIKVPLEKIYWIETEGNYSIIHTVDHKYAIKRSLRQVAKGLTNSFIQIQKAFIINCDYIQKVSPFNIQIKDHEIPIGRKFKKDFFDALIDRNKHLN